MSAGFVAWAVEALVASALLMLVILAIRLPVRRAFGAPVAYALWALPVLRLALPPLPAAWRESVAAPITPFAPSFAPSFADVGQQVTVLIVPASDGAAVAAGPVAGITLAMLWVAGAAAFLGWHVLAYRRFSRRILASAAPVDRVGGVTIVASAAAAGPLAFGVARRFVAFPRDFAGRYDDRERALALAHELGHHARGDLIANWIALAMLALHWFNPVAWIAFRAYRADQELANDARVLAGRDPAERHAYACAIVKSAHGGAIAAACHLHNVNDLKGRLRMIAAHRGSAPRLLAGAIAVAGVTLAGLGLTASGTSAAEHMRERVEAVTSSSSSSTSTSTGVVASTPAAQPRRTHRVVIVNDGRRTVYEGKAADAYADANPPPAPPAPAAAVPGVPPAPAAPAAPAAPVVPLAPPAPPVAAISCPGSEDHPLVIDQTEGRARKVIICTNRLERVTRAAEHSAAASRHAMLGALAGMRTARASILANRQLDEETRREVVADLDREIADMQREEARED